MADHILSNKINVENIFITSPLNNRVEILQKWEKNVKKEIVRNQSFVLTHSGMTIIYDWSKKRWSIFW